MAKSPCRCGSLAGIHKQAPEQPKAQWKLSNQVLEVYGAGEFAPKNTTYVDAEDDDYDWRDWGLWGVAPPYSVEYYYYAPWCNFSLNVLYTTDTVVRVIVFQPGITSIQYDFRETGNCLTGCSTLRDVYIPASVEAINPYAFQGIPDVVIHAPTGSYAEKYAKECGIKFLPTNSKISVPDTDIVISVELLPRKDKLTYRYSFRLPGGETTQNRFVAAVTDIFAWELIKSDWEVYSDEYDLDDSDCPDFGCMNDVALGVYSIDTYTFAGDRVLTVDRGDYTLQIPFDGDAVQFAQYDQLIVQAVKQALTKE